MGWIVRNPKWTIAGGVVVLSGLAWLAFGFFGVHLLFVDDKVAEAPPVFAATEGQAPAAVGSATPSQPVPTDPPVTTALGVAPSPAASVTTIPVAQSATELPVVTEYIGAFVGRDHPTSGNASVLGNGTGQRFLRFEAFETDNGPDLNVFLVNSAAGGVNDSVDLGNLQGNIGDQNYEIPTDTDLDIYDTVLIWCVRFSSPFGEATLSRT